jgi:predicted small lipoprotein YifL
MNRRFSVTAAALVALVALAGCGSSKPGSVPSSTAPSAPVTASPSDRGHSFSLVGFETNTQGVALGTNGYLWITRNGGTSWSRVTV